MRWLRIAWQLIKRTAAEWQEDKVSRLAASLTYYAVFSLAPLLVIIVAITGFIFGPQLARDEVRQQVQELVNPETAGFVADLLENASHRGTGIVATVIAVVLLLYGSTNVFAELQDAMDTIWEVQPRPGLGVVDVLRTRFLSFVMVLFLALLLLVSLVATAVLAGVSRFIGGTAAFWQWMNTLLSMGVFTLLFAAIFKFLPDARVRWRDVWIGAILTALLFTAGKHLIGLYLGRSSVTSVYGATGSLVVLLLWLYYSSHILFIGAEFTQVYARRHGEPIEPAENAVPLTEHHRIHQGIPHQQTVEASLHAQTQPPPRSREDDRLSRRPPPAPAPTPRPQGPAPAPPVRPAVDASPQAPRTVRPRQWTIGGALMLAGFIAGQLLQARRMRRRLPLSDSRAAGGLGLSLRLATDGARPRLWRRMMRSRTREWT